MNPDDPKTQKQIQVAYKGLGQLRMYDTVQLVSMKGVSCAHTHAHDVLEDWQKHIRKETLAYFTVMCLQFSKSITNISFYLSSSIFRAKEIQRAQIGKSP